MLGSPCCGGTGRRTSCRDRTHGRERSLDRRNSEPGRLALPRGRREPGGPCCVDRGAEKDQVLENEAPGVAPGCEHAGRRDQEGQGGEERGRGDQSGDGPESREPGSGRDPQGRRELDHPDQRRASPDTKCRRQPCQERRMAEQRLDRLRLETEELERSEEQKKEGETVTKDACAQGLEPLGTQEVE